MVMLCFPQPGSTLVTECLAEKMIIEVLRQHVTRHTGIGVC